MLEVLIFAVLFMIVAYGGVAAFNVSSTAGYNTRILGEQNDLREYVEQNIDCTQTISHSSAVCGTTGSATLLTPVPGYNASGTALIATPYTLMNYRHQLQVLCVGGANRIWFQVNSMTSKGDFTNGANPLFWTSMECP